MLLASVFQKSIRDRSSILFWAIGFSILGFVTTAFAPTIRDNASALADVIDSLPQAFLAAFGLSDTSELLTGAGIVNSRLYTGLGPVLIAVLAVSIGARSIAGEEESGTAELLLAMPVDRRQLVFEKFAAAVVLLGFVCLVLLVTVWIGNDVFDVGVNIAGLIGANVALWLFSLAIFSFSFALGGLIGIRSVAVGVSVAVIALMYLFDSLARVVESLAWAKRFSFFHWLADSNPLVNGLAISPTIVFALAVLAGLAVAVWGFERRDIHL